MTRALVGSVQAGNFGGNTTCNLNRNTSGNNFIADQSLDQRR
jgi:hypothetical protein